MGKHRRTLDGRLCAAAFVQNGSVYTGCADVANPDGVSGRPWCYVEPQLSGEQGSWGFCAPDIDYELVRKQVGNEIPNKVNVVRQYISHLHKAEVAAKDTLKCFMLVVDEQQLGVGKIKGPSTSMHISFAFVCCR